MGRAGSAGGLAWEIGAKLNDTSFISGLLVRSHWKGRHPGPSGGHLLWPHHSSLLRLLPALSTGAGPRWSPLCSAHVAVGRSHTQVAPT